MTKDEFIGKMLELRKDDKYVFQKACDSFDTCDDCPLRHWNDCEALMIDELCDVIIDLQNSKTETNLEHYFDDSNEGWNQTKLVPVIWLKHECTEAFKKRTDAKADLINWLLAPYEEPKPLYRLRQFEYDLIQAHQEAYGDNSLLNWEFLKEWQKKGYLRNIPDDVGVGDILKNAEVIDE